MKLAVAGACTFAQIPDSCIEGPGGERLHNSRQLHRRVQGVNCFTSTLFQIGYAAGEVLEVAAALALSMPAKVMADLSGALLLQEPQWQTSAALKLPLDGCHAPLNLSESR